ncbi:MAG: hypothetical protein CR972_01600 [Candidatus Moraniibacteriota bacterium]|nr:MAG: hypothetical protein CR972_01600 [Candidatus Moranbacteria bacterium]
MKKHIFSTKIHYTHLFTHETKKTVLYKFTVVLLIFVGYFMFVAMKYGVEHGFLVACLTWSFFVMCTPIADAGFLIDFPLRLIIHVRMVISEVLIWIIAILLNVYTFFSVPSIYDTTVILSLLKHILEKPFPFWFIIIISAIGTFASIQFGDELLDKMQHHERKKYQKHKKKYRIVFLIFICFVTFILYDFLLYKLGVEF